MKKLSAFIATMALAAVGYAQVANLQYWRPAGQDGLNVFEIPKTDTIAYDGLKVRIGGDFAMQFQALDHSNTANNLVALGSNFNLPTANLNLDVQLHDGLRMHLRTYLSARHHNEAWIKGGYLQIDKLDFIKKDFLSGLMEITTIRVGMDEFNYGDTHFRRTDNAQAIYNPFVGNYIMDAFSTEAFGEVLIQKNGFIGLLGVTNGKLNQSVITNANVGGTEADNKPSLLLKAGYDNQVSDDLRIRLTASLYRNQGTGTGTWLYGGDRGGSRYYNVLRTLADPSTTPPTAAQATDFDGRYNARFTQITAIQVTPFVKFKGLEFFGVYEVANGDGDIAANGPAPATTEGSFTQMGAELLYRFGAKENFYLGGRYNTVSGKQREDATDNLEITRLNIGGGWFMTKNILAKVEYVDQKYNGDAWGGRFAGAKFNGVMIEAVIGF